MADAVGPSPPTAETLSALGLAAGDAATSAAKDWDSVSSAANEALSIVNKTDTNEVKSYQKPSADVCDVLFAAMVCLGYPDTEMTWPKARKMLLSLIQQCKDFDSKTVDKAMTRLLALAEYRHFCEMMHRYSEEEELASGMRVMGM